MYVRSVYIQIQMVITLNMFDGDKSCNKTYIRNYISFWLG